jgi:hypothetical protein
MNTFIKRLLFLKIRRRRRYRLKDGAYVVVGAHAGKFEIDEIGSGGLSFHYIDNGFRSKGGEYDLRVVTENQQDTIRLIGRTVNESETGELIFRKAKIKRRSVRFESLDRQQKSDLKLFIKKNKA